MVPFLAQVLSLERKCNLKVVEIPITVKYGIGGTSSKNPVSHGFGVLGWLIRVISESRQKEMSEYDKNK